MNVWLAILLTLLGYAVFITVAVVIINTVLDAKGY